jgi:hypothetical protein
MDLKNFTKFKINGEYLPTDISDQDVLERVASKPELIEDLEKFGQASVYLDCKCIGEDDNDNPIEVETELGVKIVNNGLFKVLTMYETKF